MTRRGSVVVDAEDERPTFSVGERCHVLRDDVSDDPAFDGPSRPAGQVPQRLELEELTLFPCEQGAQLGLGQWRGHRVSFRSLQPESRGRITRLHPDISRSACFFPAPISTPGTIAPARHRPSSQPPSAAIRTPAPSLTIITPSVSLPPSLSLDLIFFYPLTLSPLSLPHPFLSIHYWSQFPDPSTQSSGERGRETGTRSTARSELDGGWGKDGHSARVRSLQGADSGAEQAAFEGAEATWHSGRHPAPGAECLPNARVTGDVGSDERPRPSARAHASRRDGTSPAPRPRA